VISDQRGGEQRGGEQRGGEQRDRGGVEEGPGWGGVIREEEEDACGSVFASGYAGFGYAMIFKVR
jgi:hypothetical protein